MKQTKRLKLLGDYAKKEGWLKVAFAAGYDNTAVCKAWVKRKSIPDYIWFNRLERVILGEAHVELYIK